MEGTGRLRHDISSFPPVPDFWGSGPHQPFDLAGDYLFHQLPPPQHPSYLINIFCGHLTTTFRFLYDNYARVENLKSIFLYKFKTNEVLRCNTGGQDEVSDSLGRRNSPSD